LKSPPRKPSGWLKLSGVTRNNLINLEVSIPLGKLTSLTGVSGLGKSSLVSQILVELMSTQLGNCLSTKEEVKDVLQHEVVATLGCKITAGSKNIKFMVAVNQKPIGSTQRSNLVTNNDLVDVVRNIFFLFRSGAIHSMERTDSLSKNFVNV